MSISIPIKKMSFEEKIQTMELLWDDLCRGSEVINSPSWHKDVLMEREKSLKDGTAEFIDWETAKKNIKKKLNEN